MRVCPHCTKPIKDAAEFCKWCRATVPSVAVQPTAAESRAALVKALALIAVVCGISVVVLLGLAVTGMYTLGSVIGTGPEQTKPFSVIGGGTMEVGKPPPVRETPAVKATAPTSTYHLALLSSRGYETYGYYIVEGQVKNLTDRSLENVTAVATWYDRNGQFISSDDALIEYNPLLPGQTAPFKTMTRGNPEMKRFSVEFKHLFGGRLVTDDRTVKR
jgi:hypothetical protein